MNIKRIYNNKSGGPSENRACNGDVRSRIFLTRFFGYFFSNGKSNKKKLSLKLSIFFFASLLSIKTTIAQTYPVTSNLTLVPPYSLNLPDYYAPGSNNLQVTLLLNDLNVISYDVKLRLVLRSANAIIATSQEFRPNIPITLQGGVPVNLSGAELSEYLDYNNLTFQGITRSQLSQNGGKLPEGIYQFNVEVYDYNLDVRVSNSPKVAAWMLLNDPPFLNLPQDTSKPTALDPQNLLFQWTPRHLGSPNSAFSTEYRFKLVEVWPSTINPNQAILSAAPIYTTTTSTTSLVYGPSETTLVPGRTYAWQVQATDQNNLDLFKNQGFSEVFSFTYGDECVAPTNLSAQVLNSQKIQVDWNSQWNHSKTQVEIRKYNSPNSPWTSFDAFSNQQIINQLAKGTTFEYRIRGYCGSIASPYLSDTISTPQQSARDFSCGPPVPDTSQITNTSLAVLNPNDQFIAYDYTIQVTEATKNPDDTYTGKGIVEIPAFERLKFNVKFNGITLNTDYKLIAGQVVTVYDEANGLMVDIDKLLETLGAYNGKVKTIDVNYPIDSIEILKDSNGNVTGVIVHGENGETTTYTGGINYSFTDSEGNIYKVSEGGETIKSTGTETTPITQNNTDGAGSSNAGEDGIPITTKGMIVTFLNDSNNSYAYDYPEPSIYPITKQDYEEITTANGNPYILPYKLLASAKTEFLIAQVTLTNSNTYSPDSLIFVIENEKLKTTRLTDSLYKIELTGGYNNVEQYLYAVIPATDTSKNKIAGKCKVYHVDEKEVNVTAVSVNGAQILSNLQKLITEIYTPIGIKINFKPNQSFSLNDTVWDINNDNLLEFGDIHFLDDYSDEMNKLVENYKSNNSFNETYQLFFVPFNTNHTEIAGYMPLGRQIGFIFSSEIESQKELAKTINHELAHGILLERHSFEVYSENTRGTTNLLMDYGNGINTNVANWKSIHGKKLKLYQFFDKKEKSAIISKYLDHKQVNIEQYNCFLNPTGTAITNFFYNGNILNLKEGFFDSRGSLSAFITDLNKKYVAIHQPDYSTNLISFYGYYDEAILSTPNWGKMGYDISEYNNLKVKYSIANDNQKLYAYAKYGKIDKSSNTYVFTDCWGHVEIPLSQSRYYTSDFKLPPFIIKQDDWKYADAYSGTQCDFGVTYLSIYERIKIKYEKEYDTSLTILQETELNELANYLGNLVKGKQNPVFFDYSNNFYLDVSFNLALEELGRKKIISKTKFQTVFPFVITHENSREFKGSEIIFSSHDLWDGIPQNYNVASTDFTSFNVGSFVTSSDLVDRGDELKNLLDTLYQIDPSIFHNDQSKQQNVYLEFSGFATQLINEANNVASTGFTSKDFLIRLESIYMYLGFYESYIYSYRDLRNRKITMLNQCVQCYDKTVILNAEDAGAAFPISQLDVYNQYKAKYHSDMFIYFALETGLFEMAFSMAEVNTLHQSTPKLRSSFRGFKVKKADGIFKKIVKKILKSIKSTILAKRIFKNRIKNFPKLSSKFNSLTDVEQYDFATDFADVPSTTLNKLNENNAQLVDVWRIDIRSSDIDELIAFKSKGSLRNDYIVAVNSIANRVDELRVLGKSDIEIAQEVFNLRRQTTINFKGATPDDMLDIIFEFNDIRYTQTGLGDKWGLTWNGAIMKATKNGVIDYSKIISGASTPLGDKQVLGKALYNVVGNKTLPILKKYRMTQLIEQ